MKVAPKVIVLVRDADGIGAAMADAFLPNPSSDHSTLTREKSSFELSLDKYGITDRKASGDLIQFLDPHGSPQVSILLLPNYRPPIAACAIKEILSSIATEDFSNQVTIIVPLIMKAVKFNREMMNITSTHGEIAIYGAGIGAATDYTQAMIAGIPAAPPSLHINFEPVACMLHMVRVLDVPTVLVTATSGQSQNKSSINHELEVLYEVGQFVAGRVGLCFSKDHVRWKQRETTKEAQEPWRALYG